MTEEMTSAVYTARHYAGLAVRADERGETNLKLCDIARDACRDAKNKIRDGMTKKPTLGEMGWDDFWAAAAEPTVYDTADQEMSALEGQVCRIIRRDRYGLPE